MCDGPAQCCMLMYLAFPMLSAQICEELSSEGYQFQLSPRPVPAGLVCSYACRRSHLNI